LGIPFAADEEEEEEEDGDPPFFLLDLLDEVAPVVGVVAESAGSESALK
jgi:hypothetical protein